MPDSASDSTPSRRRVEPDDLFAIKTVADVQLSPDGRRIAYVLSEIDAKKDENRSSIWIVPVEGGEPVRFTRGPKHDTAPRWSPDGSSLAFLSDRSDKHPQLYVIPATGGEPRKLTSLDRGAGSAVWSPDGTRIAFAARVAIEKPPEEKAARERWEQRPKVVTRAQYKADGQGYVFDYRTHLFVLDVGPDDANGGEPRQITDGDANDLWPAWSPDGKRIAFGRDRAGAADYSLFDVWTANVDGSEARPLSRNIGRATSPSWSPDGRTIACYGTDAQEPGFGDPMWRVWLIPVDAPGSDSGERNLTAGYDRSAVILPPPGVTPGPYWSDDGTTLSYAVSDAGNAGVVRVSVTDGAVQPVVTGERQVIGPSFAAGKIAFAATTATEPPDVFVCNADGREERRCTRVNRALLDELELPRVERRRFTGPHGEIDGWLTLPTESSRRDGPAPLLLHIHGGPHSFAGNAYAPSTFYAYVLAGRGWAVLSLNFTGSGAYGRAFADTLRGQWGEYDLPEHLAAIDALVAEGIADPDRLAVCGYSYGGYMTSWVITHSDRFRAAVVGAPVTNLESFHGTSDIGMWFGPREMKGDLVSNRETYRRLSPINYVERVTTPTLVVHGEADDRCPIEQGEQLYVGLVATGKVPAEFVRYPGGAHGFVTSGRPSHRLDYTRRVVEWVERYAR